MKDITLKELFNISMNYKTGNYSINLIIKDKNYINIANYNYTNKDHYEKNKNYFENDKVFNFEIDNLSEIIKVTLIEE